jgi:hypothetical protein
LLAGVHIHGGVGEVFGDSDEVHCSGSGWGGVSNAVVVDKEREKDC